MSKVGRQVGGCLKSALPGEWKLIGVLYFFNHFIVTFVRNTTFKPPTRICRTPTTIFRYSVWHSGKEYSQYGIQTHGLFQTNWVLLPNSEMVTVKRVDETGWGGFSEEKPSDQKE